MTGKTAFVYADRLSRHVLRAGHPMVPARIRYTYELLEALGAFNLPDSELVEPRPATEAELLTFHSQEYVAAVRSLSTGLALPDPGHYGFGQGGDNPIVEGMYDTALLSTGSSLVAAELLTSGQATVAFSPSGGLHHAMPGYASGFCIFDDPVIAINALRAEGLRVAYIDIDAHHGDGVQHAFYETDTVLTISLHESGQYLFPGTGFVGELGAGQGEGYAVNVPLAPYTGDQVYLWAFEQVVPSLIEAFQPDVLVTQLGIDTYHSDPITHLALTSRGYVQVVTALRRQAAGRPWLALGGGGYDLSAVARCWALACGVMVEREWPDPLPLDALPEEQRSLHRGATLRDAEELAPMPEAQEDARRFAEASVAEVKQRIFPFHGL